MTAFVNFKIYHTLTLWVFFQIIFPLSLFSYMFWLLAGELELHLVMCALAFFRMGHYDDLFNFCI